MDLNPISIQKCLQEQIPMTSIAKHSRVRKMLLEASIVPRGVGHKAGDEGILEMKSRRDPPPGGHEATNGVI